MKTYIDYKMLLGEGNPLLRYPRLFEAALDEFSKKKFEDASLNDILKEAEMSKGSLYHHFGDKFGLYLCMIDIFVTRKLAFFHEYLAKQDLGDFFGVVKQLVRATMEYMIVDERMHHLSNRVMEISEDMRNRLLEYYPYEFRQGFGPLIGSAIRSGQIDARFSEEFVAKVLEILLMNSHKLLTPETGMEGFVVTVERIIDFMQHGMSAKKEAD